MKSNKLILVSYCKKHVVESNACLGVQEPPLVAPLNYMGSPNIDPKIVKTWTPISWKQSYLAACLLDSQGSARQGCERCSRQEWGSLSSKTISSSIRSLIGTIVFVVLPVLSRICSSMVECRRESTDYHMVLRPAIQLLWTPTNWTPN